MRYLFAPFWWILQGLGQGLSLALRGVGRMIGRLIGWVAPWVALAVGASWLLANRPEEFNLLAGWAIVIALVAVWARAVFRKPKKKK